MAVRLDVLAQVAQDLSRKTTLEERLQLLVDRTAELLEVPRVSVRLVDPPTGRLIAKARSGGALHRGTIVDFDVGEGLIGWVVAQARPLLAGDAEADPRFAKRPGMLEPLGSFVGVPLLAGDRCIGVLGASHGRKQYFQPEHEHALTVLAGLCTPHIEAARLERLADIDALTGALNRRGLHSVMGAGPMSVVLCDIDHFKQINDAHGHSTGDEVLKRVALLLAAILRTGDAVVRWGGEEFLLILPGVDLAKAEKIAERGRRTVEEERFPGSTLRVTISAGVAERRGAELNEQLIRRADEAMYQAKRAGRNCVRADQ